MIDSSAAGESSGYTDVMFVNKGLVDFFGCILIFTDNDGISVLPEDQVFFAFVQIFKDIFLKSQIIVGISAV